MGVIARQSSKASIVVYIGILIGICNRIYFYPKFLTESELGMVTVIIGIATILSQLSFLGTSTTITKFYDYFKKKNQLSYFTGYFLSIPIFGFLIFGLIFVFFKNEVLSIFNSSKVNLGLYYYLTIPIAFLSIYMSVFVIYSHNNLRLTVPSLFTNTFLKFMFMIGLALIGLSYFVFYQFIIFIIFAYGLSAIFLGSYCYINFKPKISFKLNKISNSDYKKIFSYSSFVFLGGVSGSIVLYTDTIMLSALEGFAATGIYSIAFFAGTVIETPKKAIVSISSPIIAKLWNENNTKKINELYKSTSINQGAIGLLLLLLLWINLDEIFSILPNSKIYSTGKYVTIFIGIARVIDMFSGVNSEILQTSKKYKYNFVLMVLFIGISIGLNFYLIPIYKLNGAAIASLISILLFNVARFLLLKKYYNFMPFDKQSIKLILIFLILIIVGLNFPNIVENINQKNLFLNIFIKTVIFGTTFTYMIYKFKISNEINNVITKIFRKY